MKTKFPAPESLQTSKQTVVHIREEIAGLNRWLETNATLQTQLEQEGDITKVDVLDQIARCQTIGALLPRRIDQRSLVLTAAENSLLESCHQFIQQSLGPRIREQIVRAKTSLRKALREHFHGNDELEQAVNNSSLVVEMGNFGWRATVRNESPEQLLEYAELLLKTWDDCDEKESKLA